MVYQSAYNGVCLIGWGISCLHDTKGKEAFLDCRSHLDAEFFVVVRYDYLFHISIIRPSEGREQG